MNVTKLINLMYFIIYFAPINGLQAEELKNVCTSSLINPTNLRIHGGDYYLDADKKTIKNKNQQKVLTLPNKCNVDELYITNKGESVYSICGHTSYSLKGMPAKQVIRNKDDEYSYVWNFSYAVDRKKNQITLSDLFSKKTLTTLSLAPLENISSSRNECGLQIYNHRDNSSRIVTPAKTVNIPIADKIACSEDLNWYAWRTDSAFMLRSPTGQIKEYIIPKDKKNAFSSNKLVVTNNGSVRILNREGQLMTVDFESNQVETTQLPLNASLRLSDQVEVHNLDQTIAYTIPSQTSALCTNDFSLTAKCDCTPEQKNDLSDLSVELACSQSLNSNYWKKLKYPPPKSMSEEEWVLYLKKMQKNGGFDANVDLIILLAATRVADKSEKINNEIQRVLVKNAPIISKMKALHFFKNDFPGFTKNFLADLKDICWSEEDKKSATEKYVEQLSSLASYDSPKDIQFLLENFRPLFNELDKKSKDKIIDSVADVVAVKITSLGISSTVAYYMSKIGLENALIGNKKELIDAQYNRSDNSITILGTAAFNLKTDKMKGTTTSNDLGIVSIMSSMVSPDDIANGKKNIDVELTNGKKFKVSVKFEPLAQKVSEFVSTATSPNYKAINNDKQFNGFIVIGSNLFVDGEETKPEVLIPQYVRYYKEQGFKFKDPLYISDGKKYFLDSVAQGDIDYLGRNTHGGGNAHVVMSMSQKGYLHQGEYTDSKTGRKETITIYMPTHEEGKDWRSLKSDVIERAELAQAIEKRQTLKGDKPFISMNNGCNGIDLVPSEVASISNKNYIAIAADSAVGDFYWTPWSTERQIIDGLRNGKTYAEIRKMMRVNPEFEKSNRNQYIFPDDMVFNEKVIKNLTNMPVKETLIITEDSKPYRFADHAKH